MRMFQGCFNDLFLKDLEVAVQRQVVSACNATDPTTASITSQASARRKAVPIKYGEAVCLKEENPLTHIFYNIILVSL